MKVVRPLNYLDYSKSDAVSELTRTVGWTDYGRKHGGLISNSFKIITYHIVTGLINVGITFLVLSLPTKSVELMLPPSSATANFFSELAQSIDYVCAKLQISSSELEHLVACRTSASFTSQFGNRYRLLKISQKLFSLVLFRHLGLIHEFLYENSASHWPSA